MKFWFFFFVRIDLNYLRLILKEVVVIIERIFVYFINKIMKIGNSIDSSNDFSCFFNLLKIR